LIAPLSLIGKETGCVIAQAAQRAGGESTDDSVEFESEQREPKGPGRFSL
jgi:hypothetical protein